MPNTFKGLRVCLLDDDSANLTATTECLSAAGFRVEPFFTPDSIVEYGRIHRPDAAVVQFCGSRSKALELVDQLREVSPMTAVIISLRVHQARARSMLSGTELINLIEQKCCPREAGESHFTEPRLFAHGETQFDTRA